MSVKHLEGITSEKVAAGKDTTIQILISAEEGPNFAMRKFTIEPGGRMPEYTNSIEQEQFVLKRMIKSCVRIRIV